MMKFHWSIFLFLSLIVSCQNRKTNAANQSLTDTVSPQFQAMATAVPELAKQVLTALKNQDYLAFAAFMHPVAGVRFSPYGYIDTVTDVVLQADSFRHQASSPSATTITWGKYDGSGEPISLSIADYFKKFVYDADFLQAPQTSLNKTIKSGNSLNNLTDIYKDCVFAEYHFPGFNEKFGGMDWRSLRLVFALYNGNNYLVAVVHDQWTI